MFTGDFETTSLPHVLLGYFLWFWSCVLTQSAKSNLEAKLSSVMSTPPHSFLKAFTSYFYIYSATCSVSLYSCSPLCVWYQKRSFEGKMYDSPHLLIWSSHAPILLPIIQGVLPFVSWYGNRTLHFAICPLISLLFTSSFRGKVPLNLSF